MMACRDNFDPFGLDPNDIGKTMKVKIYSGDAEIIKNKVWENQEPRIKAKELFRQLGLVTDISTQEKSPINTNAAFPSKMRST